MNTLRYSSPRHAADALLRQGFLKEGTVEGGPDAKGMSWACPVTGRRALQVGAHVKKDELAKHDNMIDDRDNNCSLVATRHVLRGTRTEAEILAAFREEGYIENEGTYAHQQAKALNRLGIQLKRVDVLQKLNDRFFQPICLADLPKFFPEGLYMIGIRGHVLVLEDGRLYDPNIQHKSRGAKVVRIEKILNPPPKNTELRGVLRFHSCAGRHSSESYKRRYRAWFLVKEFYQTNKEWPTREWYLNHTPMTNADIEWDLKRGALIEE